jgi:hypothetical protein
MAVRAVVLPANQRSAEEVCDNLVVDFTDSLLRKLQVDILED